MAKFTVNCYYTFVGSVEVEADSIDEAYEQGYAICQEMPSNELEYCGYTDATVMDETGEIYEM